MSIQVQHIRFRVRGKTSEEWTATNEILLERELGLETDTGKFKFGDGTTPWLDLEYSGSDDADPVEIELGVSATHIQWRPVTDPPSEWVDLIALDEIKGDAGDAGPAGGPSPVTAINADTVVGALHVNSWVEVTNGPEIKLPVTGTTWEDGDFIEFCQADAEPFSLIADSGATLAPHDAAFVDVSRYQGGVIVAKVIAANTWRLAGALADAP